MKKVMKKAKQEQNYLVVFKGNWADEMDIEGFSVMNETQKNKYFDVAKKWFKENPGDTYEYCVGTNEYIEYDSFEDFKSRFNIEQITKEQSDLLLKLDIPTGFFPDGPDGFWDDEDDDTDE